MDIIVKNQIKNIEDTIQKVKTKLFIATAAYDKYYKRYYIITVLLFIFSSIVTFIEALRLSIVEYINKNDNLVINENLLTTIINVLVLALGIVITILSSIVRFKNYREILEELREKQNIIIEHIDKYKKQKNNLEFLYQTKQNNISLEEIKNIKDELDEYDTKIESTNILQYLTTKDIIKFNNYKAKFDYKIKETIVNYKKSLKTLENTEETNEKDTITVITEIKNPQNNQNNIYNPIQTNKMNQRNLFYGFH